ncbi:NAD-glutamate dehydrogenase [Stenoxybacter acetivorans]|uniref:NAD-glutamate dehydrogenase n=1 Tax=Stenoxybacter acetivorans TaxID=422441 RepID=UPI00055AD1C4|nr:NAD-glutamate dehydrogenase [Stenoxybacter acetivorans]
MDTLNTFIIELQQSAEKQNHSAEFCQFLLYYYENADLADLLACPPECLINGAFSHFEFASQARLPNELRLHYFQQESDATFAPDSTVFEIVMQDMPFLVDSLIVNLNQHHVNLRWLNHPVISTQRDSNGEVKQWLRSKNTDRNRESLIQFALDRLPESSAAALAEKLRVMLADLSAAVRDESAMHDRLNEIHAQIIAEGRSEQAETAAFLKWLAHNHYLFMGFCEYDLIQDTNGAAQLQNNPDKNLGIFTCRANHTHSIGFAALNEEDKKKWLDGERLILNKSQRRSNLHRNAYYDLVSIQKLDVLGKVVGQWRFIGLYTAQTYLSSVWDIPVLRRKVHDVVEQCDYIHGSYKDKMLRYVLQTYPRDELFEIRIDQLRHAAEGMVSLHERPRTRLFTRIDDFKRYVSATVYLPREQYDTDLRVRVQSHLAECFASAESDVATQVLSDSPLARVHFVFRTHASTLPEFDNAQLEADINTMVRGWFSDWQKTAVKQGLDSSVFADYEHAFSAGYREHFSPAQALADIGAIEIAEKKIDAEKTGKTIANGTLLTARIGTQAADYPEADKAPYWLKLYFSDDCPSLSQTLPLIENLGLSVYAEMPYELNRRRGSIGLSHLDLALADGITDAYIRLPETQSNVLNLLQAVRSGEAENDRFNALVLAAGITWRNSVLMRAIAKYLKQAALPFSQPYLEQSLARHGGIVANLAALFHARLHPNDADNERAQNLQAAIKQQLAEVPSLDDDRILNAFMTVILATQRTNFWQTDKEGKYKTEISFKISSAEIDFLPKPHPLFEIWVYSPRVEGVHLRGAKVARGGLRWSDRFEDFRTEVLGLVKAQMVKNAVIVPHGSKGGFVCKQLPPPAERDAYAAEGVACYRLFVNALLDITDNLKQGSIEVPEHVLRRDDDDPYLVVAADKGTAKFSDIANAIAQQHGFWLDDAFASGGSAGYDHKGMGITARGAWESVKRHFRHLGKDIQNEDFTVIGIGDMGGDVFGNGMLLSRHILLKAAFNHRHIFLDPNPDAEISFAERKRLFDAAAGWEQYNTALISEGGGVYERSLKSIPLSQPMQEWLGIQADHLSPNELIHELLKAEAELLYNGGIGTYIKAGSESHAQVQDRANDAVRVNGGDIKARVLGEGGNLGATQLGRIEYWQNGGLCCTDAIDNSAGVDCSDHEVNIKILLGAEMQHGRLNLAARNEVLKTMTDEVAHLVLRNNYLQTQILAMNQLNAHVFLPAHAELMRYLSEHAGLDRGLEFLPDDNAVKARDAQQQGLSNPEVAVLLSYSKIYLQSELLKSSVPDDPNFLPVLHHYFPQAIQQNYAEAMSKHYLKREIIANQLANRVVNRMGISFVQRFSTEKDADIADVVCAYWIANELFDGETWFTKLEALDNRVDAATQMRLMAAFARLLNRFARQLLRHKRPFGDIGAFIAQYREPVRSLLQQLPQWLPENENPTVAAEALRLNELVALNPEDTAILARLPFAENSLTILDLAVRQKDDVSRVAAAYFDLSRRLDMNWLYHAIAQLPRQNQWQNQACLAAREDAQQLHLSVTEKWLSAQNNAEEDKSLQVRLDKAIQQVRAMQSYGQVDLAMLSALVRSLLRLFA